MRQNTDQTSVRNEDCVAGFFFGGGVGVGGGFESGARCDVGETVEGVRDDGLYFVSAALIYVCIICGLE